MSLHDITATETRHWIFQPISENYSLPSEMAGKQVGDEDEWPVIRHHEDIHPGHLVMFYQMRFDQGVYALGEVVSEPYDSRQLTGAYPGLGNDPEKKSGVGKNEKVVRVRYTRLLAKPFGRREMREHPALRKMKMMSSSNCINCRVTTDEWAALLSLADGSPPGGRTEIEEAPRTSVPPPSGKAMSTTFSRLVEDIRSQGLTFSDETISNYLLALQAKRFVVCSGISGTGKTQLALAVAKHFRASVLQVQAHEVPVDALEVQVKPYMLKYRQMVIPASFAARVRFPPLVPGTSGGEISVNYPGGETRLTFYQDRSRNVTSVSFRTDFREWFVGALEVGDRLLLKVVENNEDEPDSLHFELPETARVEQSLQNYRVIAVRPDWTDNRGLLGFYNPILDQYSSTEFLDLLLEAQREVDRAEREERNPHPFFVILDEMNLARVEYYFSDFLSAMESGEPIELHSNPAIEEGQGEDGIPIPRRLQVPRNLFFTGTVNIDETTYMFSPKVLDRAFTLEFNAVDLVGFGRNPIEARSSIAPPFRLDLPPSPVQRGKPGPDDWDAFGLLQGGRLRNTIVELNELLAGHGRHFGYRVAIEIARFVTLAAEQAGDGEEILFSALDLAILQKVLPKFHGTQKELEEVLKDLLAFTTLGRTARTGERDDLIESPGSTFDVEAEEPRARLSPRASVLPRTSAKVSRMIDRVRRQGFASFIE